MKTKMVCLVLLVVVLGLTVLTGCRSKEDQMIDEFFIQLENDIEAFMDEFEKTVELTPEQKAEKEYILKNLSEGLQIGKSELQEKMKYAKENISSEDLQYSAGVSWEAVLQQTLDDIREGVKQQFEEASGGLVKFTYTPIKKGFIDLVWDFCKKFWWIILIVIGIIGWLMETVENVRDKRETEAENIKKRGGKEKYEQWKLRRERVCAANAKNAILVYGLGGIDNITGISTSSTDKYASFQIEVKNGLLVNQDIVEFVYEIIKFEYGVVTTEKMQEAAREKDDLLQFLASDAAKLQGLRGLPSKE